MKKATLATISLFMTIGILYLSSGCKKNASPPTACLGTLPTSVRIDTTLTFNSCYSGSGTTYLWNFGDGSTSTTNPATHAYTTTGTYTISLTVTNSNGTNTNTATITITAPSALVKTVTSGSSTTSYTYDNQGRVLTVIDGTGTSHYTYSTGSFTYAPASGTGYTATLNSSGLVTSRTDGTTYTYDGNGYNITQVNNNAGSSITNTISNGNVVTQSQTTNGVTSTILYTYLSIPDYRNYGMPYYGKSSTDVISSETVSGTTVSATYTYDSEGRVATETYTLSGTTGTNTFTYY